MAQRLATKNLKISHGVQTQTRGSIVEETLTVTNNSRQTLTGPLALVIQGLPAGVTLLNSAGTYQINPYVNILSNHATLLPGQKESIVLRFSVPQKTKENTMFFNIQALLGL